CARAGVRCGLVRPDRVVVLCTHPVKAARLQRRQPILVDATLGRGGHTELMLQRFSDAMVIGIESDTQALELAQQRLDTYSRRYTGFHGTYDEIPKALATVGAETADGYLFDLGVSSYQLDVRERGFAYSYDA